MVHRALVFHRTLAVALAAGGVLVAGLALLAGATHVAVPPLIVPLTSFGALALVTIGPTYRPDADPRAGERLAPAPVTQRRALALAAVLILPLATLVVVLAPRLSDRELWLMPAILLCWSFGYALLCIRLVHDERRDPERLRVVRLRFGGPRGLAAWRREWGDRAPADLPAPAPRSPLAPGSFWPSRDPADYR